ncbi:hypothetical protein EON63_14400 [archaeon]|nr:MAG: hypothetical protein EON63_14400 [archaeon]
MHTHIHTHYIILPFTCLLSPPCSLCMCMCFVFVLRHVYVYVSLLSCVYAMYPTLNCVCSICMHVYVTGARLSASLSLCM